MCSKTLSAVGDPSRKAGFHHNMGQGRQEEQMPFVVLEKGRQGRAERPCTAQLFSTDVQ